MSKLESSKLPSNNDVARFKQAGKKADQILSKPEHLALRIGGTMCDLSSAAVRKVFNIEDTPGRVEDSIVFFYSVIIPFYARARHKWARQLEKELEEKE